LNFFQ